jgi:hypothetical protein
MALSKPQWLYDEVTFKDVAHKHYKVHVHTINFGSMDIDDPDIYVAEPLWQWEHSERGQFVMHNSLVQPSFHKSTDVYGSISYKIVAYFDEKTLIYWKLKYV